MNELEEQRVIEALRAITGGLTVTERDTIDASTRLQQNLKAPSPRGSRAMLAVAAAVVLIVGVVAFQAITGDEKSAPDDKLTPADSLRAALQADPYTPFASEFLAGTPPTAQDVAGLWFLRLSPGENGDEFRPAPLYVDGRGYWRYGAPTEPWSFGPSVLSGDSWTRRLDERSQCARLNDQVGFLDHSTTAVLAGDGSLHVQFDRQQSCDIHGDQEVWHRIASGSPVMDYLGSASGDIAWEEPSAEDLFGTYVAPQTGHVLVVDPKGGYRYFDNLTAARLLDADSGDFEVDDAQGTVTGTCEGGTFTGRVEVGQTPGVDGYLQPLFAMRITTAENGCGSDVAEQGVWVKLYAGFSGDRYLE